MNRINRKRHEIFWSLQTNKLEFRFTEETRKYNLAELEKSIKTKKIPENCSIQEYGKNHFLPENCLACIAYLEACYWTESHGELQDE